MTRIRINIKLMDFLKKYLLFIAFGQSLLAMAGSLFFSEILKFPPCVLCWYQRIFMYPIAFILAVGIMRKDKYVSYYVLPLAIVGFLISIFHNLLYYKILPESAAPCILGVSCTTKQLEWAGFITIPFLSMIGFAIIITCMVMYNRYILKKSTMSIKSTTSTKGR